MCGLARDTREYMMRDMTKTNIIISALIVIVLAGGAYLYFTSKPSTPATTNAAAAAASGDQVQAQDVQVGSGAEAKMQSKVAVLYAGYLGEVSTSTLFDSSGAHGGAPLEIVIGCQGIIPGFQIGINGMKEGGQRVVAVPASLGYGDQDVKDSAGKVIIPAKSNLIFQIQLEKVLANDVACPTPAAQ